MSQISNGNVYLHTSNNTRLNGNMSPFTTPNLHAYKTQTTMPSVYSTLPITCHICLGKVKEPCVCPNLHAFCSFCIETWLEKSKQCPTCRIAINKENPCRRVLGSADTFDDVDMLKPTDFSHASIRKARFVNLFEQYEDEITRLNKHIDSLNVDITKLKEINSGSTGGQLQICSASPNKDLIQTLRTKLQFAQTSLEDMTRDRDRLKDSNKKLESENSILMQDLVRLKATLNEKNMMITSKYTMAALETKLESYEKEVKQLQKALDKSDKYIADLEQKSRDKENNNKSLTVYNNGSTTNKQTTSPHNANNSYNLLNSNSSTNLNAESMMTSPPCNNNSNNNNKLTTSNQMRFIKGDNQTFKTDLKIVKFAEKVDHIPASATLLSPPSNGAKTHHHNQHQQQSIITNDRFYGSPSKIQPPTPTPPPPQHLATHSVSGLMSFNERLKKNSIHLTNGSNGNNVTGVGASSKFELETPSNNNSFGGVETQSLINYDSNVNVNNNFRCNSTTSNVISQQQQQQSHQFLFSPMKRLRLEEYTLEKPSFNAEDTFNNTTNGNLNDSSAITAPQELPRSNILKTPPSSTSSNLRQVSLSPSRYSSLDIMVEPCNKKSGFSIASKSPIQNVATNGVMSRFYDELKPSTSTTSSTTSSVSSASSNGKSNNHSSPEFIDCLEILDKAEKKVQNRFSPGPPQNTHTGRGSNGSQTPQLKTSQTYDLPEKYFRPSSVINLAESSSHAIESSPLTISNVLNYNNSIKMSANDSNGLNGGGGSRGAIMGTSSSSFTLSSNSSSNNTGGNSLSATIPTGASSLASSHSSTSSFHSNSNANFMPLNMMTSGQGFDANLNGNGSSSGAGLRRFSSFDQNINDLNAQSNEFSLNSTLTNKESQHQYDNDAINRSRSVDPISRNSKA